jgi:hypothetical protein
MSARALAQEEGGHSAKTAEGGTTNFSFVSIRGFNMGWTVTTRSGGGGIVGKLIICAFGLFFAFIGSQFVKQEWQSLQETKAMQQWVHMNCTIETCTVEDAGEDFRLTLSYRYTVNGRPYTSDQYGKQRHLVRESIGGIKAAEKKLHPEKSIDGYHNPADPAQAVLDLPTLGNAKSSLAMTFLFPAFGILFAILPWLHLPALDRSHERIKLRQIASQALQR